MEKINHSSSATDDKAKYIDAMRSGRTKYRKMTPNGDVTARTYGCLAIITGTAVRPAGLEFVSWQSTGIPPRQ